MSDVKHKNLVALILGYTQDMLMHAKQKEWDAFQIKAEKRFALYELYNHLSFANETDRNFAISTIDFVHELNKEMLKRKAIRTHLKKAETRLRELLNLSQVNKANSIAKS